MSRASLVTLTTGDPRSERANPVLVLNNRQDQLFTLPEMERADRILTDVYKKAGAPDRYRANFYDGPHKFDKAMQKDAFDWFDRWLKA
ncbi:MAG: hypothetical protein WKF37_06895 [Bryobacteraceae bacterium]